MLSLCALEGRPGDGVLRPVFSLHSYCMSATREKFLFKTLFLRERLGREQLKFF